MLLRNTFIAFLVMISSIINAQVNKELKDTLDQASSALSDEPEFPETIVTDRPDQTEAPSLTPKGWFQIEAGAFSEGDQSEGVTTHQSAYTSILWKYGLSKNLEIRVITEYLGAENRADDSSQIVAEDGLSPLTIGSKIRICESYKWIPQISLITHLSLPYFGDKAFTQNYIVPRFRFLFSHGLSEKLNLSYNLGMEWEEGTSAATSIYTISLAYSLHRKVGCFIEAYGFLTENQKT